MKAKKQHMLLLLFPVFSFIFPGRISYAGLPEEFLRPRIEFSTEQSFYSGFRDSSAEVAAGSYGFTASYMGLALTYRLSSYQWKNPDDIALSGGNMPPWEEMHSVSLSGRSMVRLGENAMLLYGLRAGSAFERQLSRSLGAGADLSLMYIFNERWTGALGAVAAFHPLESTVMPALSVRYDDEDTSGFSASVGFPTQISYRINEGFRFIGAAGLSSGIYRLRDSSPAEEKGYFRYRAIVPRLGFEYRAGPGIEIRAAGMYHLDRQWRIYDRRGSRTGSMRVDSGPALAFGASFRY